METYERRTIQTVTSQYSTDQCEVTPKKTDELHTIENSILYVI